MMPLHGAVEVWGMCPFYICDCIVQTVTNIEWRQTPVHLTVFFEQETEIQLYAERKICKHVRFQ